MDLGSLAYSCFNVTESYLSIDNGTEIIKGTQNAIQLTKKYLLNDTFSRWNPLNGEISFSYNGGKDCQVLLLIYLASLWEYFLNNIQQSQFEPKYHRFNLAKLPSVLISQETVFSTIDSFVNATIDRYHLDMYYSVPDGTETKSMAKAFEDFLETNNRTKAVVLGVRRTDPFGDRLSPIQITDPEWPEFYRVQPLLHWSLENVWSYLIYFGEPMCGLYAYGYTSLGDIHNTKPNPYLRRNFTAKFEFEQELQESLKKKFGSGEVSVSKLDDEDLESSMGLTKDYYPGWYLLDDSKERAGRIKNDLKS